ncbi:hypothetical protein LTR27_007459 [Elasticomyces elasticus]|nr:hypothetical protein LTR27_007459 [Elasticomyces elasticus]
MAKEEQHFRLLDLPPELRVRLYECYFEPDPETSQAIDIFCVHDYAPKVAILRTSRLVRHESHSIGTQSIVKFFTQQKFAVDLEQDFPLTRTLSPGFQAAATALPPFPISAIRLRFSARYSWSVSVSTGSDNEDVHVVYSVWRNDQLFAGQNSATFQRAAQKVGVALTQQGGGRCLHFYNLMMALQYAFRGR